MVNKFFKNDPEKTRLNVIKKNKIDPIYIEQLKKSKLLEMGEIEAWTAIGSNAKLAYLTHGAFRFFGKFPPPVATYLLHKYTNEDSMVIDPMAGSGTTSVECIINNRRCISYDVNPLMLLLTKVKTTYLDCDLITRNMNILKSNYKPMDFKVVKSEYKGIKNPDHWFLSETMDSLYGLKFVIDKIENEKIRNFFIVCFLSIIRRVSKATSQQGRMFLDVVTAEKDVFAFFEKKVKKLKIAVSSLPVKNKINIKYNNLMDSNPIEKTENSADLIILHPPYFNSYKYSSVTSLETYWMGVDHANIRGNEIREFFKVGKPDNHEKFVEDMSKCLINSMKMLKKTGYIGFMMGDAIIKGEYIPIMKKTLEKAAIKNTNIETIAIRIPKFTESSWAASQRRKNNQVGIALCDYVVVLKK